MVKVFLVIGLLLFAVVPGGAKPSMEVAGLLGPTGMGMAHLIEASLQGETDVVYNVQLSGSPDDLVGKIISGEVHIAAVPSNLAAVLYQGTSGQVQLLAVNTLGVLYVLESGDSIHSVADLKGRTINVSGMGATPDFVLRFLLEEYDLRPDRDVTLDFKLQHGLLAAAVAAGDVELALLPQPHVTVALLNNPDLRIALDITQEWNDVVDDGSVLAMGALVVQKEFARENPDLIDAFLQDYQRSVQFVNDEVDQAAELMVQHGILPNAAMARRAIPMSNIVYVDSQRAQELLRGFFQVLHRFEPRSVGGQVPDEGFYYSR